MKPEGDALDDEQILKDLHRLLLETQVVEGKLICGNCGHEYRIKEGIANFLLPSHLGLQYFCHLYQNSFVFIGPSLTSTV